MYLLTWIPGLILFHLTGKPLKFCVHSLNLCLLSPDSGHWDLAVNNQCKVPALTKLTFQWVKTISKVYSTLGDSVWQRVIIQRWGKGEQRWLGGVAFIFGCQGRKALLWRDLWGRHKESERPSHASLGGKSTAGLKEQLRSFPKSELGTFKEQESHMPGKGSRSWR